MPQMPSKFGEAHASAAAKKRHQQHSQQLRKGQREGNIGYLEAVVEAQPD